MNLEEELASITSELEEALTEQARLSARIAGLRAHHAALSGALQSGDTTSQDLDVRTMVKSDAIVAVLRSAGRPLSIGEIVQGMHAVGRTDESYNGVSVYLQDLLSRGRVARPERGRYVSA